MSRSALKSAYLLLCLIPLLVLFFAFIIKPSTQQNKSLNNPSEANESATLSDTENSSNTATLNSKQGLIIQQSPEIYTYANLCDDLSYLRDIYGNIVHISSLGETFDNRKVYEIIVGDINASNHVLVESSIHACENITTQLTMKQLLYSLDILKWKIGSYKNIPFVDLFSDVAIHFVPMVNPDGVTLSQLGLDGMNNESTKAEIKKIAKLDDKSTVDSYYLEQWKANARGVDLNRNFDALWDQYESPSQPSAAYYKGPSPGCEVESAALIKIIETYPIKRSISYHSQGNAIYWYDGESQECRDRSKKFIHRIALITDYILCDNHTKPTFSCFNDWVTLSQQVPSVTIEVGIGSNPIEHSQIDNIWEKNKNILIETLYDIKH